MKMNEHSWPAHKPTGPVISSWFNLISAESSKEQFASTNIAEELVRLFQKQAEHEKKEMIFEVLAPLAENGNSIQLFLYPHRGN